MKNRLQTLLISFALCLCGLCTRQWYGQALQHKEITSLMQANYDQSVAIQGYTNSIGVMDHQIADMDALITQLKDVVKSNRVNIARLNRENAACSNTVVEYKAALENSEAQIKIANDNILRQNDTIKDLVAQRDDIAKRLNDSIEDRNGIVTNYNGLVKRYEELMTAYTNKMGRAR